MIHSHFPSQQFRINYYVILAATNTEIPSVSLVSRKIGMQGLYHYGKQNAADIYQLAIATRKARERPPLGDHGYYNGNTINSGYLQSQLLFAKLALFKEKNSNKFKH